MTTMTQDSNSSCANYWLMPDESQRPNTSSGTLPVWNKSRGSQTNHSLFRQYYEKKDKAVCVRDRPQAFFIECEGQNGKPRPKSAIEQRNKKKNSSDLTAMTNIIDLETETLPEEKNLQEALRRKRPDYIEKSRTREQDRLAKSVAASQKTSTVAPRTSGSIRNTSIPQAKQIYGNGQSRSRIPQISVRKNTGTGSGVSNAKKISMTNRTHALKAVQ